MTRITVNVYDANTLGRNELIGNYEFGLGYIYRLKNHELFRQWIALTDTTDKHEGCQGFLKLSISVMGPGDEQVIHSEDDVRAADGSEVILLPPKVQQEGHLLMVECHSAEGLPKVDTTGSVDPFIRISYAGNPPVCTSVKKDTTNPVWGEELSVPVMLPVMSDMIEIQLYDHEKVGKNRPLATTFFKYSSLPKGGGPASAITRWFDFYGPEDITKRSEIGHKMVRGRAEGSTWIGRALLTLYDIKHDEPAMGMKRLATVKPPTFIPLKPWLLRCDVFEATEVPVDGSAIKIRIVWGTHVLKSEKADCKNGRAQIYFPFPEVTQPYPEDPSQVPDIMVYLEKVDMIGKTRLCYLRIPVKDAKNTAPTWYVLKEDKSVDAIPKGEFPGQILMRVQCGLQAQLGPQARPQITRPNMEKYLLRVHVYQGANLLATDDDGSADPYIVVKFNGNKLKSSVKNKTLFPVWYESLETQLELPDPLEYAPDIHVLVYDKDTLTRDDFMGRFSVSLKGVTPNLPDEPTWYDLRMDDFFAPLGKILASFQLIPAKFLPVTPVNIRPEMRKCNLELTIVGLRNLEPFELLPIQSPFLVFDITDGVSLKTKKCSKPSGDNPNYLTIEKIEIEVPVKEIFAPTINIKVRDSRLAGVHTPVCGTASFSLADFLPWLNRVAPATSLSLPAPPKMEASVSGSTADDHDDGAGISAISTSAPTPTGAAAASAAAGSSGLVRKMSVLPKADSGPSTVPLLSAGTLSSGDMTAPAPAPAPAPAAGAGPASMAAASKAALTKTAGAVKKAAPSRGFFGSVVGKQDPDIPDLEDKIDVEFKPEYMIDRETVDNELEDVWDKATDFPFHEFDIYRGVQVGDDIDTPFTALNDFAANAAKLFGDSGFRTVGKFKGYVRVLPKDKAEPRSPFDLQALMAPQAFTVRVYMLRGLNLTPKDDNGASDPYIKIKLGKTKIDDRDNKIEETCQPEFYKCYELQAILPGPSQLEIEVWDYDMIGTDDLIGRTTIDLENRWFSKRWNKYAKKPVERRTLWIPTSNSPQGKVELWVDIIPLSEVPRTPKIDVSPPPKKDFEMRIIIWQARYLTCMDTITSQNDPYVVADLDGVKRQETDVHLRAKEGKGSWNHRLLYDIKLPMKTPRLRLQAWDFDLVARNDMIGESVISLEKLFKVAYKKDHRARFVAKDDPTREKMWLELKHSDREGSQGQIEVSVEVMPKPMSLLFPAGPGRKEPNLNPTLDPPDRIKFNIFRPDLMLKELLGAELYGRIARPLACLCCCLLLAGILWLIGQFTGIFSVIGAF
eukprot:TRINITY_DN16378_c0_g1_i1.p1 TRINITY_DN16378_c0_g1~~TRINITY_DN16378_c0_g1_i1.p1  ORF type:complete len:1467 (-),score=375.36 TRINITY_DN16378_c0_g1_i1:84-3968(-)